MAISMISLKAILLIYSLLALSQLTASTDHIVGGQDDGWDIGVDILSWAQAQQFNVGDTLTFKYQAYHDVLEVSKQNYDTCTSSNAFSRYTGGTTTVHLTSPGSRYFICGVPRHCNIGMKLEVNVVSSAYSPPPIYDSPPPPPPPPPPSPTYYSSPPPAPTADYSSPAPPVISASPPPSPTYYSSPPPTPTADYSSPDVSVPPSPPTTDPNSQPPPSPEMPTPPTTTGCDHTPATPPQPLMAPAPAPKRPKHKKPHHKHGKAPRHAPAPAPNAYKLSKNYVSSEQGSIASSAAPALNQLGNFRVIGLVLTVTVLMMGVL